MQWMRQSNQETLTCPICKAGITEATLIPLYSRGDEDRELYFLLT